MNQASAAAVRSFATPCQRLLHDTPAFPAGAGVRSYAVKAAQFFERALAADPKDDTGQSEIGSWYIRIGQRDKGEELLAKAFARNPDEGSHYLRAAQAFLNVPP